MIGRQAHRWSQPDLSRDLYATRNAEIPNRAVIAKTLAELQLSTTQDPAG
ncbi:MAG: hypothetical protein M3P43_00185 [Actinomycetota bacterium]|nr:hypothetical protein [Actinomycetota bacterium]